ncbi:MAG: hypothetical protein ABI597_13785 [Gammaproteobacteria bacterium]
MRKYLLILSLFSCGVIFAESTGVLSDSDIPSLRDALKKSYTLDLCRKDLPDASLQTCQCLGKAMAENLDASKLKLCQKEGYDECVAGEFTASKSALTEKQINDCKALTKEEPETDES